VDGIPAFGGQASTPTYPAGRADAQNDNYTCHPERSEGSHGFQYCTTITALHGILR